MDDQRSDRARRGDVINKETWRKSIFIICATAALISLKEAVKAFRAGENLFDPNVAYTSVALCIIFAGLTVHFYRFELAARRKEYFPTT